MAGFGSRLREKIESTRSNAATGHASSNHQPKNIRGLTRLGAAASPSGGRLSGRNSSSGGAGNSVSLPVQTFSLRKNNEGPSILVQRPPPRRFPIEGSSGGNLAPVGLDSTALLGGSKVVPGWGAGTSTDTTNAPSGHLGGIKPRDRSAPTEMKHSLVEELLPHSQQSPPSGKHVPWALHKPSSPPANFSQLSLSRRRWGDEEDDDSEEDFPQIGSQTPVSTATSHGGTSSISCERNERDQAGREKHDNGGDRLGDGSNTSGWKEKKSNDSSNRIHKRNIDRCRPARRYCDNAGIENQESGSRRQLGRYHDRENHARENSRVLYNRDRGNSRGGYFDYGSYCDNHHGDRWGKSRRELFDRRYHNDINDSRWSLAQSTHSHFGYRESAGDGSDSRGLNDFGGSRFSSRQHNLPGRSEGEETCLERNDRHVQIRLGYNYSLCPHSTVPDEKKKVEFVTGSAKSPGLMSQHSDAPRCGLSDTQLSRGGTCGHANFSLVQEHPMRDGCTSPTVLLRSIDDGHVTQAGGESSAGSSAAVTTESSPTVSSSASLLGNLERNSAPCDVSATSGPLLSTPRLPSPLEERSDQIACPVAAKELSSVFNSQPVLSPAQSQDEMKQDRKDRETEQQQNVLRLVAERRAAAAASSKCEYLPVRDNTVEWERGRKLLSNEEDGLERKNLVKGPDGFCGKVSDLDCKEHSNNCQLKAYRKPVEKNTESRNQCWREGHNHDWTECPDNHKSEAHSLKIGTKKGKPQIVRVNPCRIDGHNHDWTECPNNPKSVSFIRNNPCRIEGHKHDWNDCLDNPKSDNYVKSSKRKGRKGGKSLSSLVSGNRKHGFIGLGSGEELSENEKVSLDSRNVIKRRTSESGGDQWEDNSTKQMKSNNTTSTTDVLIDSPETTDEKLKSSRATSFIPAPPPAVSAWISGPPLAITHALPCHTTAFDPSPTSAQSTIKVLEISQPMKSPLDSAQKYLPDSKSEQAPLAAAKSPQIPQTFSLTQKSVQKLFPGNSALFGESRGSAAVYGRWNPPPMVMSSTCVDPWKPNPFAPPTVMAQPMGARFGSIWSDSAVSLANSQDNCDAGARDCALKNEPSHFVQHMQNHVDSSTTRAKKEVGQIGRTEIELAEMDSIYDNVKEVAVIHNPSNPHTPHQCTRPLLQTSCPSVLTEDFVETEGKATQKIFDAKFSFDVKSNKKKKNAVGKRSESYQSSTNLALTKKKYQSLRGYDKRKGTRHPTKGCGVCVANDGKGPEAVSRKHPKEEMSSPKSTRDYGTKSTVP